MAHISRISLDDDLDPLVDEINAASWDEDNGEFDYDVPSLAAYLSRQDTVFIVCHEDGPQGRVFQGMCSGRIELKPYGRERWLYVDEVDVCVDQRLKGVGSRMMRWLIEFAEQEGCDEVWLGTEVDNDAANALYRRLEPDDVGDVVGYTWETGD